MRRKGWLNIKHRMMNKKTNEIKLQSGATTSFDVHLSKQLPDGTSFQRQLDRRLIWIALSAIQIKTLCPLCAL